MTRAPYDPRDEFHVDPMHWILPGLAMGKRPDTYVGFDLAISCEWHLARKPMDGYAGLTLHVPMRDEDDFPLDNGAIGNAAGLAESTMRMGGKVLVHCTGGLNRSGVMVARILAVAGIAEGRDAVNLMRRIRDPFVLCNRQFERFVTGEVLPTAETSMFREDAA